MLPNNTFLGNNSVVQNNPEMSTPEENKNSEEQTNKGKFRQILNSVFPYTSCTPLKGLSVSRNVFCYSVIRSINILSFFQESRNVSF